MSHKTLILAGAIFALLGFFICAVESQKRDKAYYAKLITKLSDEKKKLIVERQKVMDEIDELQKKIKSKKKLKSRSAIESPAERKTTRLCNKFGEDGNVCIERICSNSTKLQYNSKKCLTGGCFCGSGYAYDPKKDACVLPTPPCYSEELVKSLISEIAEQAKLAGLNNATELFEKNYGGLYDTKTNKVKDTYKKFI